MSGPSVEAINSATAQATIKHHDQSLPVKTLSVFNSRLWIDSESHLSTFVSLAPSKEPRKQGNSQALQMAMSAVEEFGFRKQRCSPSPKFGQFGAQETFGILWKLPCPQDQFFFAKSGWIWIDWKQAGSACLEDAWNWPDFPNLWQQMMKSPGTLNSRTILIADAHLWCSTMHSNCEGCRDQGCCFISSSYKRFMFGVAVWKWLRKA